MFEKDYVFKGKHAGYVELLTAFLTMPEISDAKFKIFERNLDVYLLAPIVGVLYNRRADVDIAQNQPKKIEAGQMISEKRSLNYTFRLVQILHLKNEIDINTRLDNAFRYDDNSDEGKIAEAIFNSYVLGGVEVLFEKILGSSRKMPDILINMSAFIFEFENRYNTEIDINELKNLCESVGD